MDTVLRQAKERGLWDKQASSYDSRMLQMFGNAYELSIRKTRAVLAPNQRVLEIGCGTGIIARGIAPYVSKVVAADIAPQMIAAAQVKAEQQAITNVEFRVGDGYSLPIDSQSFDVVLVFNTLHVVKEPLSLLLEAYRLLKPSGHLVTATDCYAEPVPVSTRLLLTAQWALRVIGIIPFMRYYRKADLNRLVEQASFTVVDTDVLHPAPVNYYVLAQKN